MKNTIRLITAAAVFSLTGCAGYGGLSQEDYERAQQALEKGLTAWKNHESGNTWAQKGAPLRFIDGYWRYGHTLVDYRIVSLRANAGGSPEAIVDLTIKSKDSGKEGLTPTLYGINIRKADQVIISRDPMY